MLTVNAQQLRLNLKYYLDQLERGEELVIIRNSYVIGRIIPSNRVEEEANKTELQPENVHELPNNQQVIFRKFKAHENPTPVQDLHREALEAAGAYVEDSDRDFDLNGPGDYYELLGGEFWVGEIDGEIVAMGGFKTTDDDSSDIAELKRMRVKPALQGNHIGTKMLELLEQRAREHGYRAMILDVTSAKNQEPARRFYQKYGYSEMHRQHAKNFEIIYCRKEL